MPSLTKTENQHLPSSNHNFSEPKLRQRLQEINVFNSKGYTISEKPKSNSKLIFYQGVIFCTLFVGYGFYTYARKMFSYAAPTLMNLKLLTQSDAGVVNSSQYFAYAISKFIGGILSDKVSSKLLFPAGLLISGLSAVAVGLSSGTRVWAFLWFVNGLGQGCGWPACSKVLKKWFSSEQFGTFWSVLTASANVSGTVGPIAAAYCLLTFGWKMAFIICGSISITMAVISFTLIHDNPQDLSLNLNQTSNGDLQKTKVQESASYQDLLASPLLYIVSICYLVVFAAKTALSDWGPLFLIQDLGRSQIEASTFNSAFETGGFIGGILAGIVTDKLNKNFFSSGNARLMVSALFMSLCFASLHILNFVATPTTPQWALWSLGAIFGASLYGPISIFGIVASESFPAVISGAAHAIVALVANVGAIIAGWPVGHMSEIYGWRNVFLTFEVSMAVAVLLVLFTRKLQTAKRLKKE